MFELFTVIIFTWLLVKTVGLALRLTWGMAKIIAGILMVLALPMLFVFLLSVGGAVLLLPIAMIGLAAGIMKSCLCA